MLEHPSISENTSTGPILPTTSANAKINSTNEEAATTSSSDKPGKFDKIKSVFTLGAPISNKDGQIQQPSTEEQEVQSEYDELMNDPTEMERRTRAAVTIQRVWRGHVDRKRVKGMKLQRDARWDDLVKQTGEATYSKGQLDNKNDVKSRWHRAVQAASRLEKGEGVYNPPSYLTEEIPGDELDDKVRKSRKATFLGSLSFPKIGKGVDKRDEDEVLPFHSKALEQQHWLEMIDGKHRYGSNMKYYFRKWKEADTQDNFFRWLDRGDGKDLDLEEMPRERLEKERITYLSAEQRLNYLVKVDKDGLLRWARNNELVDTAAGKWKDAGDGNGIIPEDNLSDDDDGDSNEDHHSPRNAYATTSTTPWKAQHHGKSLQRCSTSTSTSSVSSDSYSAGSDFDDYEDTHYAGLDQDENEGWLEKRRKRLTPGGMRKELLRKTVRRNTWIYVSDMKLNLFVGIKQSGAFQHSSFLAGGKVTSAGIIVVKHGLIKSLNPLSGHYRSSIEHYRAFIGQLESRGVDLSHVKIAKSVLSLWGLSKYAKLTKREQSLMSSLKKTLHLSHEPTEEEKSAELQANAEREEREHQERMRKVHIAEEESGLRGDKNTSIVPAHGRKSIHDQQNEFEEEEEEEEENDEKIREVRRQVLYGKTRITEKKIENKERKEDTKEELRPV